MQHSIRAVPLTRNPGSHEPGTAGQTRDRVFRFVRDRLLAGDPQTVRAVQQVFGFRTPHTARYHLEKLVAERFFGRPQARLTFQHARAARISAYVDAHNDEGKPLNGRKQPTILAKVKRFGQRNVQVHGGPR